MIHFYRLLSIEVINGSLPTREVYQYNHRWSAAHIDVKFFTLKTPTILIVIFQNNRNKTERKNWKQCFLWTLRSKFRFLQFNRADWSANNLANKPDFNFIDLFIAKNHLECVGGYFIKFVHENFHRFEFKENNLFWTIQRWGNSQMSDNYTYLPAKLQDNEILWKSMIVQVMIELKIP